MNMGKFEVVSYTYGTNESNVMERMEYAHEQILTAPNTACRRDWFDIMKQFYNEYPIVREVWEYVENVRLLAKRFVKRVAGKIKTALNVNIDYRAKADYPEGSQLVYLIRLLDRDGSLVWSKVGTTTRTMKKRMAEHLRYYKKYGVASIEVTRVYDCGEIPAEGLESEFRSKYMRKYPGAFRKNDRFTGVEFDLAEADSIVQNYLAVEG